MVDLNSFHYRTSELNTFAFDRLTQIRVRKRLKLDEVSLTPAVAALLGQSIPEISSLQVLQLTQMDKRILQAKEIEALFGGFDKTMQLFHLTLSGFSVRGCLAPLFRSLRFFPKLIKLNLEMLNMDEHDLSGLLESFQFIPNLQKLKLCYLTERKNPSTKHNRLTESGTACGRQTSWLHSYKY